MWKALRIEALADTIAAEPAARLAENRLDIGRRQRPQRIGHWIDVSRCGHNQLPRSSKMTTRRKARSRSLGWGKDLTDRGSAFPACKQEIGAAFWEDAGAGVAFSAQCGIEASDEGMTVDRLAEEGNSTGRLCSLADSLFGEGGNEDDRHIWTAYGQLVLQF
jgi:hypothetical protein